MTERLVNSRDKSTMATVASAEPHAQAVDFRLVRANPPAIRGLDEISRLAMPIGALLVLFSATGFSAKAIFVKLAYTYGVDSVTLLALRMLFSLPFFVFMAWWSERSSNTKLTRRQWWSVAALGVTGYYLASFLDFLGLQYISAGLERLTLFLNPTFVVLLSVIMFARPIRRADWIAFAISYAGIALAFWHDLKQAENSRVVLGTVLVLASAVSYAVYLVGSGQLVRKAGSMRYTAYAMLAATVAAFIQFAALRPFTVLVQPWEVYGYSLAMAVLATVLPVWMMAEGVRRMGSASASMIGMAGPIITIFMGSVFLGEPIGVEQLIGAALVLTGVAVITFWRPASS
jgi:drug/metabolite transporter (DMT)-like permease